MLQYVTSGLVFQYSLSIYTVTLVSSWSAALEFGIVKSEIPSTDFKYFIQLEINSLGDC